MENQKVLTDNRGIGVVEIILILVIFCLLYTSDAADD